MMKTTGFGIFGASFFFALAGAADLQAGETRILHLNPSIYGQVWFEIESGKIGCMYTPKGGTPHDAIKISEAEFKCEHLVDPYRLYTLGERGPPSVKTEFDLSGFSEDSTKLPNGWTTRWWLVTCKAGKDSIECKRKDGHGFFIGPSGDRVW